MDSDRIQNCDYTMSMMHLGIDVREACTPQRTGKGQWTYGFVSELLTRDLSLTLFSDRALPPEWQHILENNSDRLKASISAIQGLRWHLQTAQAVKNDETMDAYVSTVSYIVPYLIARKKKVIPIVHDLISFHNEPHDRKATMIERLTLKRAVFSAAHICTVSASTKQDLLTRYPSLASEKVTPIFAGPVSKNISGRLSDGTTILCIATLCPRKNQLRLVEAFAKLPDALRSASRLVLVGKRGWDDEEILKKISATPNVEWKDYLSDSDCEDLYRAAAVFAFPSLYEGFGMPILDAFRFGVPVLASDRGSLKEVAGDAALLVDPENVDAIASGLERLLTDAALRESLTQKGIRQSTLFSWKKTVDIFLASV